MQSFQRISLSLFPPHKGSFLSSHLETNITSHTMVVMDENLWTPDLTEINVDESLNSIALNVKEHSGEKSNKCNQCGYASSYIGALKTHLKTHSVERSSKCNQCTFASFHASSLRVHLKMHSGEKPNKCNQCTMGRAQCKTGNRKVSTSPLILSVSKYFR